MIGLIIAFAVGLVLSISLTPLFIRYLVHNHYGQFIRQDGPTSHMTKRGTQQWAALSSFCHCRCTVYRNPD